MNEPRRSRESAAPGSPRPGTPDRGPAAPGAGRSGGGPSPGGGGRRCRAGLGHAPPAGQHSDRADEHEVDDGSQGPRMLPASAVTAEPTFGPPQASLREGAQTPGSSPSTRGKGVIKGD
jgi:hypothetical protein